MMCGPSGVGVDYAVIGFVIKGNDIIVFSIKKKYIITVNSI